MGLRWPVEHSKEKGSDCEGAHFAVMGYSYVGPDYGAVYYVKSPEDKF